MILFYFYKTTHFTFYPYKIVIYKTDIIGIHVHVLCFKNFLTEQNTKLFFFHVFKKISFSERGLACNIFIFMAGGAPSGAALIVSEQWF